MVFASVAAAPVAVLYAATRPERTCALILLNSFTGSHDVDPNVSPEEFERYIGWVERVWGSGQFLRTTIADVPVDDALLRDLARGERQSMAPGVVGAWLRWLYAIDVRAVLPAISAPTLVMHTVQNRVSSIEPGRYLAHHIPNARLVELPGADVSVFLGSAVATLAIDEIEEFLTGTRVTADHARMLTTLMFTDVVGSTDRVAAIGDRAWRAVLDRHDDAVRHQLARFSGHQQNFTGDGVLATFDGPARAIRCGTAIRDAARQIGIDVRAVSTPVRWNGAAPSSPVSPSTWRIAYAKPPSPARSSCHARSSISSQDQVSPSRTVVNSNSKAYPPHGASSPSTPELTGPSPTGSGTCVERSGSSW